MAVKKYDRHGAAVYRDPRWPIVRLEAKRRDGWKCVKCGARGRIEVDHIKPVRTHPALAFDLNNLQCLCPRHHAQKTRIECGFAELSPARAAWRDLLATMAKPQSKELKCCSQ